MASPGEAGGLYVIRGRAGLGLPLAQERPRTGQPAGSPTRGGLGWDRAAMGRGMALAGLRGGDQRAFEPGKAVCFSE